jgi:hypothetical protein
VGSGIDEAPGSPGVESFPGRKPGGFAAGGQHGACPSGLPPTLGLTNGRDEIGLGQGICLAEVVDAGIKRHFPNLTQIQVNAVIGFVVGDFCEQNAGKLGS